MPNDHDSFEQLGLDVRTGGPLPQPFTEASARDVACAIHVLLVEVGLSPAMIRKVGYALIRENEIDECGGYEPHARETQGENRP